MAQIRKSTLPTPLSIGISYTRAVALVLTVGSGIWMNHATEAGSLTLASHIAVAHAVCGILFIVLALTHVWNNRRRYADMMAQPNSWRLHADQRVWPVYTVLFLCTAVSALVMACGNAGATAFHCGCGLLLGVIGIFHFTLGKK